MNKKGFTLIELLVVIAIIGLLSTLAVVSLSSARNKAYDAQVKSDLSQFRTYAELQKSAEGAYPADLDTADAPIDAPTCSGDYAVIPGKDPASAPTSYAAYGKLCAEGTTADPKYFCVDSSGAAQVIEDVPATPADGVSAVCVIANP